MKKLIKEIFVYRALSKGETGLFCNPYSSNLISEAYSRTLKSSSLNMNPTIHCCSEDPRIALVYAKRDGYSGQIARITLLIYDNGEVSIKGMDGQAYRLWMMEDWLNLAALSERGLVVKNLNYARDDVKLANVISYGGQGTARSYGFIKKMWLLHTEGNAINEYEHLLSEEEINDIKKIKRFRYPSYKSIHYTNTRIIEICNSLIQHFEEYSNKNVNAWVKCTIQELKRIKADVKERVVI